MTLHLCSMQCAHAHDPAVRMNVRAGDVPRRHKWLGRAGMPAHVRWNRVAVSELGRPAGAGVR